MRATHTRLAGRPLFQSLLGVAREVPGSWSSRRHLVERRAEVHAFSVSGSLPLWSRPDSDDIVAADPPGFTIHRSQGGRARHVASSR